MTGIALASGMVSAGIREPQRFSTPESRLFNPSSNGKSGSLQTQDD
jgi:hypothetical protein